MNKNQDWLINQITEQVNLHKSPDEFNHFEGNNEVEYSSDSGCYEFKLEGLNIPVLVDNSGMGLRVYWEAEVYTYLLQLIDNNYKWVDVDEMDKLKDIDIEIMNRLK